MSTLHRREFVVSAKAAAGEQRIADLVASTDTLDSYGEVLLQDWDLERYKKNPVVLFGHDDSIPPIGFAKAVAVVGGQLRATVQFVDGRASPVAEAAWQGIVQGSLRGVSVGFRPGAAEMKEIGGTQVVIVSKCELFEISIVPIGANPDALIERTKSIGALRKMAKPIPARPPSDLETTLVEHGAAVFKETGDIEKAKRATEEALVRHLVAGGMPEARALIAVDASATIADVLLTARKEPPTMKTKNEPRLTWNGKTYPQMGFMERHALAREDRKLFDAMREELGLEPARIDTTNATNVKTGARATVDVDAHRKAIAARGVRK